MSQRLSSMPVAEGSDPYSKHIGERLRAIRQSRGLSLENLQKISGGEFKASIVGAYERGDRTMNVGRLGRLASFYRVSLRDLVPGASPSCRVDLFRLALVEQPETQMIYRYLSVVRLQHSDSIDQEVDLFEADIHAIARLLRCDDLSVASRLEGFGVVADRPDRTAPSGGVAMR